MRKKTLSEVQKEQDSMQTGVTETKNPEKEVLTEVPSQSASNVSESASDKKEVLSEVSTQENKEFANEEIITQVYPVTGFGEFTFMANTEKANKFASENNLELTKITHTTTSTIVEFKKKK